MTATYIFMSLMILAAIAFDIGIAIAGGPNATISARTWALSKRWPIIPLAVGILCGHLFWSQC